MTTRIERKPLVQEVRERLLDDIASGTYPVGSKLPAEPELQEMFGVGRSTVREAVRILSHEGLLDVRPGNGTFVIEQTPRSESLARRLRRAQAQEVYEARRALELETVRLAALRRSAADLRAMKADLRKRAQFLDEPEQFLRADLDFHLRIAQATKNPVLAELYATFFSALREALAQSAALPGIREEGQGLHEQLFEAIEGRDPDAAVATMEKVLNSTGQRLAEVLGGSRPRRPGARRASKPKAAAS